MRAHFNSWIPRCLLGFLAVLMIPACSRSSGGSGGVIPPPPPPGTAPTITGPASPLPAGYLGVAYGPVTFTASGDTPITWSVTGGTIPTDMTLSSGGVYSGTPGAGGSFSFTVTATNSAGSTFAVYSHTINVSIAEVEPNDTSGTATALQGGLPGHGSLASAGDVDYWSFSATSGAIYRLEIFGTRRDHGTWDTGGTNPRTTVFGPGGTAFIVGHDPFILEAGTEVGWQWGIHDLDTPLFRAASSGTHYVRVEQQDPSLSGGLYALKVVPVPAGMLQAESEPNNSPPSEVNSIAPGLLFGERVDGDDDWYSFTLSGPATVYFEVTAYRNGVSGVAGTRDDDYFDPAIGLFDSAGTLLFYDDDVYFYDSAMSYRITAAGTYYLAVTESSFGTAGDGPYFLRFAADTTAATAESEPNEDSSSATAISYGDIVSGTTDNTPDTDFFSFTATAGDMVSVFFHDFGTHQDAIGWINIQLLGPDGSTPVNYADDYAGDFNMNHLRALIPASGTYYVVVTFFGGPLGTETNTDYSFQLVLAKDAGYETEANDTIASANAIPMIGRIAGAIDTTGDLDVFSFTASAPGEVITISAYSGFNTLPASNGFYNHRIWSTALSPTLTVMDGMGTPLASSGYGGTTAAAEGIDNGLATLEVTFVAPSAGTYYVEVADAFDTGSADHLYMIEKR